jgi:hypothetical protein
MTWLLLVVNATVANPVIDVISSLGALQSGGGLLAFSGEKNRYNTRISTLRGWGNASIVKFLISGR